jgi:hypothetical protein
MRTKFHDAAYEIYILEKGKWNWWGIVAAMSIGRVTLPKGVYDRIAQRKTGRLEVDGQQYWIKKCAA